MRARLFLLFLLLASCNKDPPPKAKDEPPKTTPVPSDMVFNDFLPSGGGGSGLSVRVDGGALEGGLASADGTPAAGGSDPAQDEATKLHVTDPGAEPRTARKYTFTANKVDKRVITLRQSVNQGGRAQDMPALALTVELTPKKVQPAGASFEMKVVSVDLADKDKIPKDVQARAAQELGMFSGLLATFDVDARGAVGEVSMQASDKMQKAGASELVNAFQQAVELMLPPLPDAPIGVGAKWERSLDSKQGGVDVKGKHKFEAKDLTNDGGTILASIDQKIAKRPYPDPRLPKGTTVAEDETGSYTYTFRFDHVATKVEGELKKKQTIEVTQNGKAETVIAEVKQAHSMVPAK